MRLAACRHPRAQLLSPSKNLARHGPTLQSFFAWVLLRFVWESAAAIMVWRERERHPRCTRSCTLETAGQRGCNDCSGREAPGVVPFAVSAGPSTCLFPSRRVAVRQPFPLPLNAVAGDFFS
jgi:hypothetical protein